MTEVMVGDLTEGQPVITGPATQQSGANGASSLLKFRLW
jgi:hypothetical protein